MPNNVLKALSQPGWHSAVTKEMDALNDIGVDYSDTCPPVAKMTYVRLFISLAATHDWDLHRLDIKNAFCHGDLPKEVYME